MKKGTSPPTPGTPIHTSERILDEAERLIALKGVYGFTLQDIADPLGFRVPAIYKHYESRDDVLVAVSRRYIALHAGQFQYTPQQLSSPAATLREVVQEFARFHLLHPAYVRLSLIDFATPQGGMEYIRRAAGGTFRDNLSSGPLAPMHRRLKRLLAAGQRAGAFRATRELEFYRLIKASLLLRLVFPDDLLAASPQGRRVRTAIETSLWEVARRFVAQD